MEPLEQTYFFRHLEPAELAALQAITRLVEARKGDLVLRQGQPADDLFIVRSGSVRVVLPAADGQQVAPDEQTLVVIGPGECFGEFAFVDRKPSSATVVANEDATLYALFHRDLDALLARSPATAVKIYRALLETVVRRLRNTDIELAVRKAFGE